MESGLRLLEITSRSAQAIVNEIGKIVGQNINMMDQDGVIIASTDRKRIGHLHDGARRIIQEKLSELYTTPETAGNTMRVGLNLPIMHEGRIAGVVGITGEYDQVRPYGEIVKRMVEILIRENLAQDEQRLKNRVLSRFLEDWVLGEGLLKRDFLTERGYQLGIDVSLPRRVMVVSAKSLDKLISTSEGQKLLERMEKETGELLKEYPGSMILRNTGRQIILLNRCSDGQMRKLAERMNGMAEEKYKLTLAVGLDGNGEDVHTAYSQANRAWRSARLSSVSVCSYAQVTLELFTCDLSGQIKMNYIHKVFTGCEYEEICQWMEILEAYFAAEGSIQSASDALFIHKNTMTYKLKKLHEITGYDVRLVSNTTVFYMALLFFKDVKQELEHRGM